MNPLQMQGEALEQQTDADLCLQNDDPQFKNVREIQTWKPVLSMTLTNINTKHGLELKRSMS